MNRALSTHRLGHLPPALGSPEGVPTPRLPSPPPLGRLKRFNAAFEELAIKQAAWDIPDEERRKKTRVLVARRLKSMYSKFLLPYR